MKQITLLIIVLFSISFSSCNKNKVAKVPLPEGYYENDWNQALTAASDHERNIFVQFYADWCDLCASFKEDVLNDAEVESYMKEKFVGVLMDSEKDKGLELIEKHNFSGHPYFAVFDKDGNVIASKKGKLTKEAFLTWIKDYE